MDSHEQNMPASEGSHSKGRRRAWKPLAVILVIVILLGLVKVAYIQGWIPGVSATMPDRNLYQAVFLNNGQVYFGKLKTGNKNLVLTDIYYLQVIQPLQQQAQTPGTTPAANQQPQLNLVKIGSEIHGPTDKMVIPKSSITFWEDIKSDGSVAKAIAEYEAKQK